MAHRYIIGREIIGSVVRLGLAMWVAVLLGSAVTPRAAQAQAGAPPEFEVNAVSVRGDEGRTRLDIYTKVPYDRLRFLNTANGFTAAYEVTAEIFALGDDGRVQRLALTRVWESKAVVGTFIATRADGLYDRTLHTVELSPGRYALSVKLEDQDTGEAYVSELPVTVRNLSGPVAVSDVLLLDDYDEATNTITPSVDARIGTDELGVRAFYEVYADRARTVEVTREVVPVAKGRDQEVSGAPLYRATERTALRRGTNQAIVLAAVDNLKVGDYALRVRVEDESGRLLAAVEQPFMVEWTGLEDHVQNLDDAISQLQYIAKGRDLRRIREARTRAERLQLFQQFWDKRDPTPGTVRNERMEEYYYRIAFANREYGSITDGWKTDRGQVLVLFGEPDHVERHPYNFNTKPYQVWYYYRIGKQFIFVDDTGFGDYELLIPIWDERNRIR